MLIQRSIYADRLLKIQPESNLLLQFDKSTSAGRFLKLVYSVRCRGVKNTRAEHRVHQIMVFGRILLRLNTPAYAPTEPTHLADLSIEGKNLNFTFFKKSFH